VPGDSRAQTQRSVIKNRRDAAIDPSEGTTTTAACGGKNETRADGRQQEQVRRQGERQHDASPHADDSNSFPEKPRHRT
jgi:hypothetical protein